MLRMIEGFDVWDHKSKGLKRFAGVYDVSSTSAFGVPYYDSTDIAAINDDDCYNISINQGRYPNSNSLVVVNKVHNIQTNCDILCEANQIAVGGFVRIPIPLIIGPSSTDYNGVYGFSFKFDKSYGTYYAPGGTTGNSTGQAIFAIGQGPSSTVNFYPFVAIYLDTNNKLQIRAQNSGSTLGLNFYSAEQTNPTWNFVLTTDSAGSFALEANTWYNIEIRTALSTSGATNRIQQLYVNGNLYATSTITSTPNVSIHPYYAYFMSMIALNGATQSALPEASTVGDINHYFDNFYVADNFGPIPNNVLGSWKTSKIEVVNDYVNEGTYTGAATPYQAISGNDEGTSYVNIVSGIREIYEFSNLPTSDTICGVSYKVVSEIPNATGLRLVPIYATDAGVQHSGLTDIRGRIALSGGGWFYHESVMPSSLATNSPWTFSEINDGRFGFTLRS